MHAGLHISICFVNTVRKLNNEVLQDYLEMEQMPSLENIFLFWANMIAHEIYILAIKVRDRAMF